MDAKLPSVSEPNFIPDLSDDCNVESRNSYVSQQKMGKLMKDTIGNQFCPKTNPFLTNLKNQDKLNQERKMRLTSNPNLLSTEWCPGNFQQSWLTFIDNNLQDKIRSAGKTENDKE